MTSDDGRDKLDDAMEEQAAAMAKLQSTVAENKTASEGMKKALERLDGARARIEEKD
jgi:hypothetical protein